MKDTTKPRRQTSTIPIEVATNLDDLMRFEYRIGSGNILPDRPIYSILEGRHASKMRGRGLDFEEVRLYAPGDDIRNIDWKVTARNKDTYSKVFNEEKERPAFTLLDQSKAMFFGSERYVKSVTAAHIAALAAFYIVKRGDRFGGLIFNEEGYDHFSPGRNKTQVQRFLRSTVQRNNALPQRRVIKPNPELMGEMLRRTQSFVTRDYVVIVISDLLALSDTSRYILRSLALRNDVIFVHIEDPMDEHLPLGKLILTDGDKQIVWKGDKDDQSEKYASDYRRRLASSIEEFRRYHIPVSVMSTALSIEDQIKERMGRRLKKAMN